MAQWPVFSLQDDCIELHQGYLYSKHVARQGLLVVLAWVCVLIRFAHSSGLSALGGKCPPYTETAVVVLPEAAPWSPCTRADRHICSTLAAADGFGAWAAALVARWH